MRRGVEIVVVAGELSGDMHAARILRAMRELLPGLRAWGFGGDHLAREGMEIREHIRDLSVMGFVEVMKRYGYFRKVFWELVREIRERRPSLVLLVDYPGFNLRLAGALKGTGIRVVQYVCPQVWAWKAGRIPKMAGILDELICIFPFEPALFEGTRLPARYLGHPLVDEVEGTEADGGWKGEGRLAVVPGSRRQEIDRLFLPMMETAERLRRTFPGLEVRVPAADAGLRDRMRELLAGRPDLVAPEIVEGRMREVVKGADAALVTSGTATLETALLGVPMVIAYKTSGLTYAIGKRVVKVKWIGMANLLMGRGIFPEFLQGEAEPEKMACALEGLMPGGDAREAQLQAMAELRGLMVSDRHGMAVAEVLVSGLRAE